MSDDNSKSGIARRDALKALALLPFAAAWDFSSPQLARAATVFTPEFAAPSSAPYAPKFFTKHEWTTVSMLADYIIPKDEHSGSATDAKVPEYMDWLMADSEASLNTKTAMRGGLAWLDREAFERFGKTFVNSTDAQRRQILDDIAWPAKAKPEMSQGVAFFNRFRDLTASGFFSSEMGYKDVRFVGNVFNPNWNGCPPEAMAKLGVSHDLMKTRVKVE
ncbi:MAG TPA: gluconate 2-dehydrogenase subunit 3 family protein [Gemmatimonadaceae bacterium]|nr:gluconate 2-dehydrogenase subunit 3 family protein [Gemmatimonadaceae bacterium]